MDIQNFKVTFPLKELQHEMLLKSALKEGLTQTAFCRRILSGILLSFFFKVLIYKPNVFSSCGENSLYVGRTLARRNQGHTYGMTTTFTRQIRRDDTKVTSFFLKVMPLFYRHLEACDSAVLSTISEVLAEFENGIAL